jgi:hypothetical protein
MSTLEIIHHFLPGNQERRPDTRSRQGNFFEQPDM